MYQVSRLRLKFFLSLEKKSERKKIEKSVTDKYRYF